MALGRLRGTGEGGGMGIPGRNEGQIEDTKERATPKEMADKELQGSAVLRASVSRALWSVLGYISDHDLCFTGMTWEGWTFNTLA